MAVNKLVGTAPDFGALIVGRIALEETLARFDEQVTQFGPETIRERLRKKLSEKLNPAIDDTKKG